MFDYEGMKEIVAGGLSDFIGCPVIQSNQNKKPPAYPYGSYTITTPMGGNKGTYGKYEDGKERKPFTQIWSLTIQAADEDECLKLANKAHEWLDYVGKSYLNDNGVIVQSVGDVGSRDNILTIEYEYKKGFDIVFWCLNEISDTAETTGIVEGVEFENKPVIEPLDYEELTTKLSKRLEGES